MRKAAKIFAGPGMLLAGINHFVNPKMYRPIMPDYLPAHHELILASGAAELLSGLGTLVPATRRKAGWLSIATLVAVSPVHVWMLQKHEERYAKIPKWALWARLPLQLWMIWAVWDTTQTQDVAGEDTTLTV
ncbi:MAG: hypothetical protein JWM31_669 [Solirubrobacterales bacterium]|nr:hypothetical protein [Solirubrobacterales bacterium]